MFAALREQAILSRANQVRSEAGKVARRVPRTVSIDDLVQAGWIGAIAAVDNYNPDVCMLSTYAEYKIRGAILDYLRQVDPLSRAHRREVKGSDLAPTHCSIAAAVRIAAPGDFVTDLVTLRTVKQLRRRARLTETQKLVLRLNLYEGMSCSDISRDVLHGSVSLASQYKQCAIAKLRRVA